MKKKIKILLGVVFAIVAVVIVSACAAADSAPMPASAPMPDSTPVTAPAAAAPMPEAEWDIAWDMAEDEPYWAVDAPAEDSIIITGAQSSGADAAAVAANEQVSLAEKIIHTVNAGVETVRFDETIENVHRLIVTHGAFIENSSVSGINHEARHFGWNAFRNAFFTIRVPVQNLNTFANNLNVLGNVVSQSSHAQNITMQFHDTQSRLNSLRIQEERLLDMLSRADDVPDLIAIEERLGEVRMQVESFQTMINLWQNQVDYSTLTLNIWEVEEFTEFEPIHRSYWEQIADGFARTLRNIGNFFMDLFMWLIVNIPVLIILAVITVAAVIVTKRIIKKRKEAKVKKTPE